MSEEGFVTIKLPEAVDGVSELRFPNTMSQDEMAERVREFTGQNKNFLQKSIDAIDNTIDWFKGGKRDETIPLANQSNLGLPADKAAKMAGLLATTASDERLQSGISAIIPGAQFAKDKFDNLVVISPVYKDGQPTQQFKRFYPNPKGLDVTDLMQASGVLAAANPIMKGLQIIGAPVRGMLGSGLIGMTESGLIEAISSKLSNKPYQVSDVPMGFGGGVLGEKVITLGAKLANVFRRDPGALFDQYGVLDSKIEGQLRDAGIDPDTVTPDTLRQIIENVNKGVDPAEAAVTAEAQNLPVSVPMTSGAITGDAGQQLFEDAAEKGAFGETARNLITSRNAETQAALQQNVPAIRDRIAGDSPVVDAPGDAGPVVQQNLLEQRDAASAQANRLYDEARASGPAAMDGNFAEQRFNNIIDEMAENFEFELIPNTAKLMNRLQEYGGNMSDVRQLFALRTQITNAGKDLGQDGAAARELKNKFDDALTEAMENSLIYGDDVAVAKWKSAVSNYKDFATKWNTKGDILRALTEKQNGNLKVTPESASNYIFNFTNNRLSPNPKMAAQILKLKQTLPKEQFDQIRQEAFLRIAEAGKTARGDTDMFSGIKFRKEFKNLMSKNPTLMKSLFSPEERSLIEQFANVAARATSGAKNTSNSANATFTILGRLAGAFGATNTGQFLTRVVGTNMIRNAYGSARAASSLSPNFTPQAFPQRAGIGGAAANTEESRQAVEDQVDRTFNLNLGLVQ
jgi:hypothetical protein